MLKFYEFRQNNSGGHFVEVENGCNHLIVEASCASEANIIAQEYGVYFNGVRDGYDCSCCGDRWYPVSEYDGSEEEEYVDGFEPGYFVVRDV